MPRSRRHPHFRAEAIEHWLPDHGVEYTHMPELGGCGRPAARSPNAVWRNEAFRGSADHAIGPEFAAALEQLLELATERPTAMTCSEALWWRCHRRLIADRIVAGGGSVAHISSDGRAVAHVLTPFAAIDPQGGLTYPPAPVGGRAIGMKLTGSGSTSSTRPRGSPRLATSSSSRACETNVAAMAVSTTLLARCRTHGYSGSCPKRVRRDALGGGISRHPKETQAMDNEQWQDTVSALVDAKRYSRVRGRSLMDPTVRLQASNKRSTPRSRASTRTTQSVCERLTPTSSPVKVQEFWEKYGELPDFAAGI